MASLCDHCDAAPALLYCRADAAKLCLACDRHVHAANPIFSKHSRFHLCDGCGAAAATILCDAHRLLLCPNCDFDAHPPAADHHRRPLEPLSGCPSALELAAGFGFDEDDKSMWLGGDGDGGAAGWGDGGGLVWDTPSVVCMSDLIVPVELHLEPENPDFQVLDVPPPPKV